MMMMMMMIILFSEIFFIFVFLSCLSFTSSFFFFFPIFLSNCLHKFTYSSQAYFILSSLHFYSPFFMSTLLSSLLLYSLQFYSILVTSILFSSIILFFLYFSSLLYSTLFFSFLFFPTHHCSYLSFSPFRASQATSIPTKIYAVEKNLHAVITLRNRALSEEWENVQIIEKGEVVSTHVPSQNAYIFLFSLSLLSSPFILF